MAMGAATPYPHPYLRLSHNSCCLPPLPCVPLSPLRRFPYPTGDWIPDLHNGSHGRVHVRHRCPCAPVRGPQGYYRFTKPFPHLERTAGRVHWELDATTSVPRSTFDSTGYYGAVELSISWRYHA